jgi:hypothetical protein
MAQRIKLDMDRIEAHYKIEEDGMIWSNRLERYLHPTKSGGYYSYYYVCLKDANMTWVSIHKLVASKYLGACPERKEISHKDGNKWNNHWTNLEYLTHSENLYKSFAEHGRKPGPGNHTPRSVEHKMALAQAKFKPVYCSDGRSWKSINECAAAISKTRVSVHLSIKEGWELRGVGGMLGYSLPVAEPKPKINNNDKKNKRVCSSDGRVWDSIQECADKLGVDRKAVYNSIRWHRPIKRFDVQLAQL